MFADGAVPLLTSALPSLIVTYHCPPLSPLRLNWIVAFTPLAAFGSSCPGIAEKISSGVIEQLLLSMGWWGLTALRRPGPILLSRLPDPSDGRFRAADRSTRVDVIASHRIS